MARQECSNCGGKHGTSKVDLGSWPMSDPVRRKEDCYFCVYCSNSVAGNAYLYPDQYQGASAMKALAAMMNVLEDRIKRNRR